MGHSPFGAPGPSPFFCKSAQLSRVDAGPGVEITSEPCSWGQLTAGLKSSLWGEWRHPAEELSPFLHALGQKHLV